MLRIQIQSRMLLASRSQIRIYKYEVRIPLRIWLLLSSSKNRKKTLIHTFSDFFMFLFSLKIDVNVASEKVISKKTYNPDPLFRGSSDLLGTIPLWNRIQICRLKYRCKRTLAINMFEIIPSTEKKKNYYSYVLHTYLKEY